MRLLSASALWWLLLGAVIIFFYLLKLKRRRRVVPSVFLWQRALDEIEANAPFKRLRRNLLLLLQLAVLALLVFALARPLVATRALATGSTIIIIDSTASMSARDEEGRSRLDRARELARDLVAGLGTADRAAVIESSARVTVRSPLTSDRAALASGINQIQQTDAAGSLADAILLAEQMAGSEPDAGVVIIGDGGGSLSHSPLIRRSGDGAGQENSPRASLRFVRVGSTSDNVGIVAFNSRPVQAGARRELFASVANFGEQERAADLELRIDGKLADARSIRVPAKGRTGVVFDALPQAGGLAELKMSADDALASDNLAYASLPDARRSRLGVAAQNSFLLQSLIVNPDVAARRMSESALTDFDCLLVEGDMPPGVLESDRPLLVINPADSTALWRLDGARERPDVSQVDGSHPVNSFLSYGDLNIESAPRIEAASWLKPIVAGASGPLIWAGDDGRRRVVLIGLDLAKTDLPLKIEFPLLVANTLAWLSGREGMADERAVRAGQPVTIRQAADAVQITPPDGEARALSIKNGAGTFADTLHAGLYEVSGGRTFAASLLSEAESDITPRDTIQTRAGDVSGQAETFISEREAWRWLAVVALAILFFEWWVYHKRIN